MYTEMCIFMDKELREPRARGWTRQEAGLTQFLIHIQRLAKVLVRGLVTYVPAS